MKIGATIAVHRPTLVCCAILVACVAIVEARSGAVWADGATKDAKAVAIIEAAVAELGGEKYLSLKGIETRGVFRPFAQGQRGLPIEFVDTFVYPDSERTEFGKKKSR